MYLYTDLILILFESWGETFRDVFKEFITWFIFEGTFIWYLIMFIAVFLFTIWNKKCNKNVELQQRIDDFLPPLSLLPFIALAVILVTFLYLPIATTIKNYQRNREQSIVVKYKCDPAYPDVCIPSPPPDLNCEDITYRNFRVTGNDPHWFDLDEDGIGCEVVIEN